MTADRMTEGTFVKAISEAALQSQINLFQQAWGIGDSQNNNKGDNRSKPGEQKGYNNPFLSVLTGPIGKIGEAYMQQAQRDINEALKQDIYRSRT